MAKLIVGLGNPGKEYEKTRHNAGWIALDTLMEFYNVDKKPDKFKSNIYVSKINGENIFFVKPKTFMNLSGEAVRALMNYYKLQVKDILIIYDDKDLEVADLRFRESGSAGGHNGIKNIISNLNTDKFNRLRIGVGKPPSNFKIIDWVLSKLSTNEIIKIKEAIEKVADFVKMFVIDDDLKKIMNKFN